jgi:predicted porin
MPQKTPLTPFLSIAALCMSTATFAQTPTFYGLLDVGLENVSNVGTGGDSVTRVPSNTNTLPSRLGVRGNVDFGDGMGAIYTAEMGIDAGNGNLNQGGRTFGRQVFAGLSTPYGNVTIGRQYTMTFWSGLDADILGGGIYGTGSLDAYLPNARADNAIAWTHKFSGLTLGAEYSVGRDTVNGNPPNPSATNCPGESTDAAACRQWSVMAKYDTPTWGVAFAQDQMSGRTVGAAPDAIFGGLNASGKSDTRTTLNAWFKFDQVKLGGGVIRRVNDGSATTPNSDLLHVGVIYPVTPKFSLSGQWATLNYTASSDYNASLVGLRGSYALFKGADVYAQWGNIQNSSKSAVSVSGGATGSNPSAGASQSAVNVGFRYSF